MVLDGKASIPSKWKALGGKLWMGDITPHPKTGKRVQDVKITGIPLENAKLAIRMCRIKTKRIMSEAQKAAAEAALSKARGFAPTPPQKQPHGVESIGKASVDPGTRLPVFSDELVQIQLNGHWRATQG